MNLLLKFFFHQVWTPDIVLYNSAGDGEQGREMRTLIQVISLYLGTVVYNSARDWPQGQGGENPHTGDQPLSWYCAI
jgi:hypothetical protein